RDRFQDWLKARAVARAKQEQEKIKARMSKQLLTTQLIQRRAAAPKTGVERFAEEMAAKRDAGGREQGAGMSPAASSPAPAAANASDPADVTFGTRADSERKGKTVLPRIAGGYKLPSTSLLHRPDEQHAIDEDDLKDLAQVLVAKCAEFDVHGAITQINPGPVVTTFEMKPEAGIKYSRITGLQDDLCLALRAESVLIERMPGKATARIHGPHPHPQTICLPDVLHGPHFPAP